MCFINAPEETMLWLDIVGCILQNGIKKTNQSKYRGALCIMQLISTVKKCLQGLHFAKWDQSIAISKKACRTMHLNFT